MALSGLVHVFTTARRERDVATVRADMAEDQLADIQSWLAMWFVDSHEGARDFLREIALEHREKNPLPVDIGNGGSDAPITQ